MHESLASPRSEHQRLAVGGQQHASRRGLHVIGPQHVAGVDYHCLHAGVIPHPLQHRLLAEALASGIKTIGKGRTHRLRLVGGVRLGPVSYGVDRRHMHQTSDSMMFHCCYHTHAKVAVHPEIVLQMQQAHIGHTGTIDHRFAAFSGTEKGIIVERGAFEHFKTGDGDSQRATATDKDHDAVAFGE